MSELLFTRQAVREVDRRAIADFALHGVVLMENAGRQVADHAQAMLGLASPPSGGTEGGSRRTVRTDRKHPSPGPCPEGRGTVLVIAGGGNNGGDGFVAARHLHNRGVDVVIHATRADADYAGDAAVNLAVAHAMGLRFTDSIDSGEWSLILDCLLGTGLTSNVRGRAAELIDWMNAQPTPVLAVDLPSGLDCDTGRPLGVAVRADRTVTFVGPKRGFVEPGAADYTGAVHVADIGAPRELIEQLGETFSR